MTWEYRQWVVNTKGWIDLKLPDEYIDQMVPIHTGISGTSAVVFLLKRPQNGVQS